MVLKYYFDLLSQPSRALYIFLKSTRIPFEECPVALRKGEHLGDNFAAINPFKKVPAIDDDGFRLSESIAVLDGHPKVAAYKERVRQRLSPVYDEAHSINRVLHSKIVAGKL